MMKNSAYSLVVSIGLVLIFSCAWAADTTLRCGNELVERGDTMFKVRQACGEPKSTQRVGERTSYTILQDQQLKVKDVVYIEEWVYEKDSGIYILTFEGSRLAKKEYAR